MLNGKDYYRLKNYFNQHGYNFKRHINRNAQNGQFTDEIEQMNQYDRNVYKQQVQKEQYEAELESIPDDEPEKEELKKKIEETQEQIENLIAEAERFEKEVPWTSYSINYNGKEKDPNGRFIDNDYFKYSIETIDEFTDKMSQKVRKEKKEKNPALQFHENLLSNLVKDFEISTTDDIIEKTKEQVFASCDFEEILNYYNIDVVTRNDKKHELGLVCMFHDDHSPSLVVNTEKKVYNCLACDAGGTVIDFVDNYENEILKGVKGYHKTIKTKQSRIHALNKIIDICHLDINKISYSKESQLTNNFGKTYDENGKRKIATLTKFLNLAYQILQFAEPGALEKPSNYYDTDKVNQYETTAAKNYMIQRGLSNAKNQGDIDVSQKLKFGFMTLRNMNQWIHDGQLPKIPAFEGESLETLYNAGILGMSQFGEYYYKFSNRILIPICDKKGNVVSVSGREIDELVKDRDPNIKAKKYLHGNNSDIFKRNDILYNLNNLNNDVELQGNSKQIYICEGFFDVAGGIKMGMPNFVSSLGTGLVDGQVDIIKSLRQKKEIEEVILARDSDDAGIQSVLDEVKKLKANHVPVRVLDTAMLSKELEKRVPKGTPLKDMWDFANAGATRKDVEKCTISVIEFFCKYKYFKNEEITVQKLADMEHSIRTEEKSYISIKEINQARMNAFKDELLNSSRDIVELCDYITKHSSYTKEDLNRFFADKTFEMNIYENVQYDSQLEEKLHQSERNNEDLQNKILAQQNEIQLLQKQLEQIKVEMRSIQEKGIVPNTDHKTQKKTFGEITKEYAYSSQKNSENYIHYTNLYNSEIKGNISQYENKSEAPERINENVKSKVSEEKIAAYKNSPTKEMKIHRDLWIKKDKNNVSNNLIYSYYTKQKGYDPKIVRTLIDQGYLAQGTSLNGVPAAIVTTFKDKEHKEICSVRYESISKNKEFVLYVDSKNKENGIQYSKSNKDYEQKLSKDYEKGILLQNSTSNKKELLCFENVSELMAFYTVAKENKLPMENYDLYTCGDVSHASSIPRVCSTNGYKNVSLFFTSHGDRTVAQKEIKKINMHYNGKIVARDGAFVDQKCFALLNQRMSGKTYINQNLNKQR